jgi:hypothetical protein
MPKHPNELNMLQDETREMAFLEAELLSLGHVAAVKAQYARHAVSYTVVMR